MGTVTELPPGGSRALHDLARVIARWLYRPAFRIRVHGIERVPRTGPVVLIANHSSMIEPQLIFGLVPRRTVFLVKEEMFARPAGFWLRKLGQLPVRRGEPDRMPLLAAVRTLRAGGLVAVFPEGTRGPGNVDRAERGAAWLVRSSGAVVQPVATRGTLRPEGALRRRFRPTVDIAFGEPFSVDVQHGRAGLQAATERMRGELADAVRALDLVRERAGIPAPRPEPLRKQRDERA